MKLKDSLCLPRTEFPMKASLPLREPERLARWSAEDLHGAIGRARAGAPRYVLHDGPPYANGHVHLGTALNKILKDFVVKARSQAGFDTPYVPGWDCHGMPIEHAVLKAARVAAEQISPEEIRKRCREFAAEFVDTQRAEFKRLGVFGYWDEPYLTYEPQFEASIVGAFRRLHDAGYLAKGLRPIHWCPTCRTALANAEIEHDPAHESIAIHVRFEVAGGAKAEEMSLPPGAALVAWTTTPWTIPANVALAVHPELEYALVGGDANNSIVALDMVARIAADVGWKDAPVLRQWRGAEMEGLNTRHPLVDRLSPVVLGDHVTTEAGTGVVHTAPGHGAEDFETGRRYGLPTLVPVDKAGRFTAEAIRHVGRPVLEANADIVADLRAAGALVREAVIVHSYPTCWRCRGAVIFLATDQWFWRVDHLDLRARALEHVDARTWIPAWGHDRMHDSVSSRPDWCLSRQRSWGVPIPAFECRACGTPVVSSESLARAEQVVREGGSEAWIATPAAQLAPAGLACANCGGTDLEKDPNILDVWFDSACTHLAVLKSGRWPQVEWPADLYLEAVDQHRGWFQVSLLSGVALEGAPPFKAVYTHGLILDEQGRKMSKSLGNVVAPEEILKTNGADILRLLFASLDCTADIRFSKGLLEPAAESYRKIRNTLRFLMGNLASFDPDQHAVGDDALTATDRFAMERLRQVSQEVRAAYDELLFNKALRLIHVYLATDVSAFCAHVTKDRLYCDAPDSASRRSAQTLLFEIARECCSLLAPILCFTADEAWEHLPAWSGKASSVHVGSWRKLPEPSAAILADWAETMVARSEILKALERAREAGLIGDPLEASITVGASGPLAEILKRREAVLAEILVVSAASVAPAGANAPPSAVASDSVEGLWVSVARAPGVKCPRCWQYRQDAGGFAAEPLACGRCARVLTSLGVELDPA